MAALTQTGEVQDQALSDLREYLLRAVFVYLRDGRNELAALSADELLEMAEDYAQAALINLQNNLEKFRGDAKFTTWAYRFVINEAAADLRRRRYREFSWEAVSDMETAVFSPLFSTPPKADPELKAERKELAAFLARVLDTELNEQQRAAMLGIHFQGRSVQEVAELLETSPNTVYKMVHDARKKIKAKLLARHYSAGDILGLFDSLW